MNLQSNNTKYPADYDIRRRDKDFFLSEYKAQISQ